MEIKYDLFARDVFDGTLNMIFDFKFANNSYTTQLQMRNASSVHVM